MQLAQVLMSKIESVSTPPYNSSESKSSALYLHHGQYPKERARELHPLVRTEDHVPVRGNFQTDLEQ
jgi:hypothetical protein